MLCLCLASLRLPLPLLGDAALATVAPLSKPLPYAVVQEFDHHPVESLVQTHDLRFERGPGRNSLAVRQRDSFAAHSLSAQRTLALANLSAGRHFQPNLARRDKDQVIHRPFVHILGQSPITLLLV